MQKEFKNRGINRKEKGNRSYYMPLDIVYILDKSGSMSGTEKTTVNGFNDYIKEEQRKYKKVMNIFHKTLNDAYKQGILVDPMIPIEPTVSLVLFDNDYHYVFKDKRLLDIKRLDYEDYRPSGSTALLDTIGNVILDLDKKKSNKAIIMITTDGYENSSMEFTREKIKDMIKTHDNYTVVYIGADIDSYMEARSIGIKDELIANYAKNEECERMKSRSLNNLTECVCFSESIDNSWKEDLDKFIEKNKD